MTNWKKREERRHEIDGKMMQEKGRKKRRKWREEKRHGRREKEKQ